MAARAHLHAADRGADDLVAEDLVAGSDELNSSATALIRLLTMRLASPLISKPFNTFDPDTSLELEKVVVAIHLDGGIFKATQYVALQETIAVALVLDEHALVEGARCHVQDGMAGRASDPDGHKAAGDRAVPERTPSTSASMPTPRCWRHRRRWGMIAHDREAAKVEHAAIDGNRRVGRADEIAVQTRAPGDGVAAFDSAPDGRREKERQGSWPRQRRNRARAAGDSGA